MRKSGCVAALGLALTFLLVTGCTDPKVSDAISAIDAIGNVTIESRPDIEEACEKYDSLDSEQKEQVSNSDVLDAAIDRLDELDREQEYIDEAMDAWENSRESMQNNYPSFSEWGVARMAAAQNEMNALEGYSLDRFEDNEFKQFATSYVQAIKNECQGLEGYPADAAKYNALFVEQGIKLRMQLLNELKQNDALSVDAGLIDGILDELGEEDRMLVPLGQTVEISTPEGDVRLTIEGFSKTVSDISGLVEMGLLASEQTVGYLLFTIENLSRPVGEDYEEYMRFDELAFVTEPTGISLEPFDYSGDYPGYSGVGAGVFGVYTGSDIQVGQTKRMCIPYIINVSAYELCVEFSTGEMSVLTISQ